MVQGGLVWFRTLIIAGSFNMLTSQNEILVFSRETKLDARYILHREKFDSEILAMNITASHLLVYTSDAIIRYYTIHIKDHNCVEFKLRQALSVLSFIGADEMRNIRCISRYPQFQMDLSTNVVKDISDSAILFLKHGQLFQISKLRDGEMWEAALVAEHVENFWVGGRENGVSQLQRAIWVFDGKGASIINQETDSSFHMATDFYPLCVMVGYGVLLGIQQELLFDSQLELCQFGTKIKVPLIVNVDIPIHSADCKESFGIRVLGFLC